MPQAQVRQRQAAQALDLLVQWEPLHRGEHEPSALRVHAQNRLIYNTLDRVHTISPASQRY